MFEFLCLEMLEKQEIIRNMYRFYLQHNYQTMLWVNAYANINANVDIWLHLYNRTDNSSIEPLHHTQIPEERGFIRS